MKEPLTYHSDYTTAPFVLNFRPFISKGWDGLEGESREKQPDEGNCYEVTGCYFV